MDHSLFYPTSLFRLWNKPAPVHLPSSVRPKAGGSGSGDSRSTSATASIRSLLCFSLGDAAFLQRWPAFLLIDAPFFLLPLSSKSSASRFSEVGASFWQSL